jgi:hypothetical protein
LLGKNTKKTLKLCDEKKVQLFESRRKQLKTKNVQTSFETDSTTTETPKNNKIRRMMIVL